MKLYQYTTPKVSARDRIAFTLFLAIVFNAAIILGIGFDLTKLNSSEGKFPTMDVILVDENKSEAPDKADFLAQTSQSGAGNSAEMKQRPSTLEASSASPLDIPGDSDTLQPEQTVAQTQPASEDILTSYQSDEKVQTNEEQSKEQAKQPSPAQLIALGKEIARLSAELDQSMEIYSKKPKHRFISANTKAHRDAAYLNSWRQKVERVGNLHYPEAARRDKLSGSLILDVAINADGTINQVTLLKSSGYKLLDDAAMRIVRLSAPFAPLPEEMKKDTDILHITRAWNFLSEGLTTR